MRIIIFYDKEQEDYSITRMRLLNELRREANEKVFKTNDGFYTSKVEVLFVPNSNKIKENSNSNNVYCYDLNCFELNEIVALFRSCYSMKKVYVLEKHYLNNKNISNISDILECYHIEYLDENTIVSMNDRYRIIYEDFMELNQYLAHYVLEKMTKKKEELNNLEKVLCEIQNLKESSN